jgi:hypothetical protein
MKSPAALLSGFFVRNSQGIYRATLDVENSWRLCFVKSNRID